MPLLCSPSQRSIDIAAWVGRNEDSLLRAPEENRSSGQQGVVPAPTQISLVVWLWRHNMRAISVSEHLLLILPFFMRGGVALHGRLVGISLPLARRPLVSFPSRLQADRGKLVAVLSVRLVLP